MSIFYCNFLSISPLFLYDTTINFWFPPLFYHDPSSSKQTMKHSFPMSLPKYSETTFPWIPPPTLFTHGVEPGIVLSLVEPPLPHPPTSLTLESSRLDLHVVQSSIVLRLVEHAMEAEHSGQIDEFLLGRGGQDVVPLRLQMLLFLLWLWFNFGFPDLAYKIKVKQFIISLHCVLTGSSSALTFGSTLGFPETVPWKKFAKRHQNLIPWFSGSTAYF